MDLLLDANNNAEKSYSLRPRAAPKRDEEETEQNEEESRKEARKRRKPKQKPGRLSKYRRKTANARERSRMREINEAFEALRCAVPHLAPCGDSAGEKLTKISTLRLAMKYIAALSAALTDPEEEAQEDLFSVSDYSLTPGDPRDTSVTPSMTPSSSSDHSDFFDLFQKSQPREDDFTPPEVLAPPPPFFQPLGHQALAPGPLGSSAPLAPLAPLLDPAPPELDSLLYPSLNFDELFIT